MRRSRRTMVKWMRVIQPAWALLLVGFVSWQTTRRVAERLGRPLAWWEWGAGMALGVVVGLGFLLVATAAILGPTWLVATFIEGLRRLIRRPR